MIISFSLNACLCKSEGEIPFQIDLPQEFVHKHATELQSGLSKVAVCLWQNNRLHRAGPSRHTQRH